jgi:small conductance mechanosensitive channel
MQKRIRIALEKNNMLPGSPFRVTGGKSLPAPGEQITGEQAKPEPAADPTTNKPNETNPFSGE